MKHELWVTLMLIGIFAISQVAGLFLVAHSTQAVECAEVNGTVQCTSVYEDTAVGDRPQTSGAGSLLYIIVSIAIGTALLLLLARYQKQNLWRLWFFVAVWLATAIALGVVMRTWLAWALALGLAAWKIFKPNIVVYNVVEILMYAGIAVLIVPIFDKVWIGILLLAIISVYDAYAVWKSKHMVKMAKFITESNAFAGLLIPYKAKMGQPTKKAEKAVQKGPTKNAILGGGDITFPLLFAGIVMQEHVQRLVAAGMGFGAALQESYLVSLVIGLGATIAIAGLFLFAKKDTFYPAMPFVSAGCLVGWVVTLLL